MARIWRKFADARDGAVMVEFTIIVTLLLVVTLGFVDFSMALYQWNGASKAAEVGARLAAVSGPVASNLSTFAPTAAFSVVCTGGTASCTGGGAYAAAAMQTIVYGRGNINCTAVAAGQPPAMCNVYPGLATSNVKVTYQQSAYATSGLSYTGRADGPVPTITVETIGLTFNFFFLNGLLGLAPMNMPTMRTTIIGEDLSSSGS